MADPPSRDESDAGQAPGAPSPAAAPPVRPPVQPPPRPTVGKTLIAGSHAFDAAKSAEPKAVPKTEGFAAVPEREPQAPPKQGSVRPPGGLDATVGFEAMPDLRAPPATPRMPASGPVTSAFDPRRQSRTPNQYEGASPPQQGVTAPARRGTVAFEAKPDMTRTVGFVPEGEAGAPPGPRQGRRNKAMSNTMAFGQAPTDLERATQQLVDEARQRLEAGKAQSGQNLSRTVAFGALPEDVAAPPQAAAASAPSMQRTMAFEAVEPAPVTPRGQGPRPESAPVTPRGQGPGQTPAAPAPREEPTGPTQGRPARKALSNTIAFGESSEIRQAIDEAAAKAEIAKAEDAKRKDMSRTVAFGEMDQAQLERIREQGRAQAHKSEPPQLGKPPSTPPIAQAPPRAGLAATMAFSASSEDVEAARALIKKSKSEPPMLAQEPDGPSEHQGPPSDMMKTVAFTPSSEPPTAPRPPVAPPRPAPRSTPQPPAQKLADLSATLAFDHSAVDQAPVLDIGQPVYPPTAGGPSPDDAANAVNRAPFDGKPRPSAKKTMMGGMGNLSKPMQDVVHSPARSEPPPAGPGRGHATSLGLGLPTPPGLSPSPAQPPPGSAMQPPTADGSGRYAPPTHDPSGSFAPAQEPSGVFAQPLAQDPSGSFAPPVDPSGAYGPPQAYPMAPQPFAAQMAPAKKSSGMLIGVVVAAVGLVVGVAIVLLFWLL